MNSFFQQIISHFPQRTMRLAFAYGSGVFQQHGTANMSKNMVDFVFAVEDPVQWHNDNIERNFKHYSGLRHLGSKYISYLQEHMGARIYYNTLVMCEGRLIKYGVISVQSLIDDLLDWESLYVSGRLHKPVKMLMLDSNESELNLAMATNLKSAVHASLLLLPEQFSEEDLYVTLAALSYNGDFRMMVGEDRNKVYNIVRPNTDRFRRLYENILGNDEHLHWNRIGKKIEQCQSPASNYHHLNLLPKWLMFRLVNARSVDGRHRDTEQVLRSLANDGECSLVLQSCLTAIVRRSSVTQTAKGILTAGPKKSITYALNKLRKMLKV